MVQKKSNRRLTGKKPPAYKKRSRLFLPWPIITFLLLSIGVLLLGWTFQTEADDIHVTAKVSAPLPSGPALITSPGDGTHFNEAPITVSGTCPLDTYIILYRNDFFSGTVLCSTDGNFSLDIDLFPGANKLQAKVFNITDDEGPQSGPITVYYDVPEQPTKGGETPSQPTTNPPSTGGVPLPSVAPFTLNTEFNYKGYKVGQIIDWTFEVGGGHAPYALNIDWGDGTNSVISQKEAGKITVKHQYKKGGSGLKYSYLIKVTGSDNDGRNAYLQTFLIVHPAGVTGFVANSLPKGPKIQSSWLKLIWPAYFVVILMALSFWLGEREELYELKNRRVLRRRHS